MSFPANTKIFLIRHAEKPDTGDGLSPAGQARANAYVKYLQSLKDAKGNVITWKYLFACKLSDNSNRPLLTITPLATALGMDVDDNYKDKHYEELVADLSSEMYADSNILVCWHHGEILDLAAGLGASCATLPPTSNWPAKWPGDVFGWLLKIYYGPDGAIDLSSTEAINEKLMPDDKVDPVFDQ